MVSEEAKKDLVKFGIGAGIVGSLAFLGYEAIVSITGPPGGSCATPGSPCYECMAPYESQLKNLTTQFNAYYAGIITQDSAANSGITANQQNIIDNFQTQINAQILGIQKCAKQYTPSTWQDVAGGIVTAIVIIAVGIAIAKIIQSLRSYRKPPSDRNGGGGGWISNMLLNANLQKAVDNKKITPENASALSSSANSLTSQQQSEIQVFTSSMVSASLITAEEAAAIAAAMAAVITVDTAETLILIAAV